MHFTACVTQNYGLDLEFDTLSTEGKQQKRPAQVNKRGDSARAKDKDHRCRMNIKFFMHSYDGSWHLHTGSSFHHEFHVREDDVACLLKPTDLNPDHKSALNILYKNGVPASVIANVMGKMVHVSSDKKGTSF